MIHHVSARAPLPLGRVGAGGRAWGRDTCVRVRKKRKSLFRMSHSAANQLHVLGRLVLLEPHGARLPDLVGITGTHSALLLERVGTGAGRGVAPCHREKKSYFEE